MAYNWAPVFGRYSIDVDRITFLGGEYDYGEGRIGPQIGNLICDQQFSGGDIRADVTFDGPIDEDAGCEIIVYWEPATQYFVSAGLGGAPKSEFTARYFDAKGWNLLAVRGDRANLMADLGYRLLVRLRGSILQLLVNGVEVIRTVLPFSLPSGQVGLWFKGRKNIHVRGFEVHSEKPTAFVAMQFSPPYNELYQDVIRPICHEFGIEVKRSDETFGPGLIIADIMDQIHRAKIFIADITPENSNVFYEVGYAHAYRKPTILIAEKGRALPFDVSGFRILFYENTIAGKKKIEEGRRQHVNAILTEHQIRSG